MGRVPTSGADRLIYIRQHFQKPGHRTDRRHTEKGSGAGRLTSWDSTRRQKKYHAAGIPLLEKSHSLPPHRRGQVKKHFPRAAGFWIEFFTTRKKTVQPGEQTKQHGVVGTSSAKIQYGYGAGYLPGDIGCRVSARRTAQKNTQDDFKTV